MQESYLTERDKRLSKPAIGGAVVATFLLLRIAIRVIVTGDQESVKPLLFALAMLAGILGIWLAGRKASVQK